jgi:hypothetical protein
MKFPPPGELASRMRRTLPLWLLAIVPATIAGHALSYALAGRSMADARHSWISPVLEWSLALLGAAALAAAGGALVKAGILARPVAERSAFALWARLAPAQALLFVLVERAEGVSPSLAGYAVQILVALAAALLLASLARLLGECIRSADRAQAYLERVFAPQGFLLAARPPRPVFVLAATAGPHRFQRPPP